MKLSKKVKPNRSSGTLQQRLLAAALGYARAGLRVLPLSCRKKQPPLIKDWNRRATTDLEQIERWWTKWPNANVGIATGADSDTVVLDIDRHKTNGFTTLKGLTDQFGELPPTKVVKTAGKGVHYYFRTNQRFKSGSNVLGPGIDVRAEDGYVVAPPSVVEGGEYVWCN